MRKVLLIVSLIVFFYCSLSPVTCPLTYAQDSSSLINENARLQAELNKMTLQRNELIKNFKMLTDQNTKFKDEITYLENGIIKLDNARKAAEETNRALTDRMAELQDELQPINKKLAKPKASSAATTTEGKSVAELKETIDALQIERLEYMDRKKALDGQISSASSDFSENNKELTRLKTESAIMHYNLGVIFQKADRLDDAIREYKKVLETIPNDPDTNFNLALIYETAKNDRDKAVFYYQKYLEANPSAKDADTVKEHITNINLEGRIWGEPHLGGIKERTRRYW